MDTNISPSVSVIVPVYKAVDYISATLENLRHQTLSNIEIIFVDDHGNDGTIPIIEKAAEEDNRIVLLSTETNSGPGKARNIGIEAAKGEYIGFIDADDQISLNYYESLYNQAKRTNSLVVRGILVHRYDNGVDKISQLSLKLKDRINAGNALINVFNYEHVTGIYNRDFIMEINARNGECSQGEDNIFLMKVMSHLSLNRFSTVDDAIYYYRKSTASISNAINADYMQQSYESLKQRLLYLATINNDESIQKFVAEQFEEKIYYRLKRVLLSEDLSIRNLKDYLNQCFASMENWLKDHDNRFLKTYSKRAIAEGYDSDKYIKLVQTEMKQGDKNKQRVHNRDLLLLVCEKKIERRYRYYKFMSLITWGRQHKKYETKRDKLKRMVRQIRDMKLSMCREQKDFSLFLK